jgi:hypothetical protein
MAIYRRLIHCGWSAGLTMFGFRLNLRLRKPLRPLPNDAHEGHGKLIWFYVGRRKGFFAVCNIWLTR